MPVTLSGLLHGMRQGNGDETGKGWGRRGGKRRRREKGVVGMGEGKGGRGRREGTNFDEVPGGCEHAELSELPDGGGERLQLVGIDPEELELHEIPHLGRKLCQLVVLQVECVEVFETFDLRGETLRAAGRDLRGSGAHPINSGSWEGKGGRGGPSGGGTLGPAS